MFLKFASCLAGKDSQQSIPWSKKTHCPDEQETLHVMSITKLQKPVVLYNWCGEYITRTM